MKHGYPSFSSWISHCMSTQYFIRSLRLLPSPYICQHQLPSPNPYAFSLRSSSPKPFFPNNPLACSASMRSASLCWLRLFPICQMKPQAIMQSSINATNSQHKISGIQGGFEGYWEVPIKPNITPISWPTEGGGMYGFLGCWLDILMTLKTKCLVGKRQCFMYLKGL